MQLEITPLVKAKLGRMSSTHVLSAADVPTLGSQSYKHYTYTEALEKDKKKEYSCKIITTRSSCLDSKKHALYNTMSSEQNIARKISTQCSWVDLICFFEIRLKFVSKFLCFRSNHFTAQHA